MTLDFWTFFEKSWNFCKKGYNLFIRKLKTKHIAEIGVTCWCAVPLDSYRKRENSPRL